MTHPASSQPHDADWYEIRVQGRLDPRWSAYLDGAQLAPGSGGTTVLTGRVVDQAALHGLLTGLRDLGLPLISLARVDHEPDHPHQEPTGEPT
ncbi:MAG: hypothetical protein ACJ715_05675 [Ornithinibacter sp.]